ncbi:MAG TPA: AAA family ATPase [Jatrophihabitans sp.]|nr:AAA family ATPase [Jatrophihabitans sp.]
MARLVLINGAPGSGKSTIAHRLAQDGPLDLALDVDVIKHSLGQWDADMTAAGYHARRLTLAVVDAQLASGHDVFIGQFLARTEFIEQLDHAAAARGATFVEVVLVVDAATLERRLRQRADHAERAEHLVNAALVAPDDVPRLVQAMNQLAALRPSAIRVDASDGVDATVERVRRVSAAR